MQKPAFTLIELVLVIVILGILAVLAIPVYQSLRVPAINSAEDGVAAALKEAIYHKYSENIASGSSEASAWPRVNPFSLLAQSPPNRSTQSSKVEGCWMSYNFAASGTQLWMIFCPHWDGNSYGNDYTKGRAYFYSYGNHPQYPPGTFILYRNGGH